MSRIWGGQAYGQRSPPQMGKGSTAPVAALLSGRPTSAARREPLTSIFCPVAKNNYVRSPMPKVESPGGRALFAESDDAYCSPRHSALALRDPDRWDRTDGTGPMGPELTAPLVFISEHRFAALNAPAQKVAPTVSVSISL